MLSRQLVKPAGLLRPVQLIKSRSFHSVYHADIPELDSDTLENKILSKAYLEYAPELGFTNVALTQSMKDLGYSSNNLQGLFNFTTSSKDLVMELVLYHLKYQRVKLIDLHQKADALSSETDRLKFYLQERLIANSPIIKHYHKALAQMIMPSNISYSLEELHNLSDDISFYAGDKSNDFAWYTKRMSVSSIFVNSELFMLNDTSKDFTRTIEFMNDRVDGVDKLAYAYNSFEEWSLFNAISMVNLIKSQLIRG